MQDLNSPNGEIQSNDSINIRQELERYVFHWKWFVLCSIVALGLAFMYLRYSTPQYNATATIMIKDNQKSGISDELKAVADLGIVGTGSSNNTDNEVEIIKSRKIIGNVIDTLNLNIRYFVEGRVIKRELYNKKPIKITFLDTTSHTFLFKKDTLIAIEIVNNKKYLLKNQFDETVNEYFFSNRVNDSVFGHFTVHLLERDFKIKSDIFIQISNRDKVIDGYREAINVTPIDKNSSVIKLSIKNNLLAKAEDFLDELVYQYNLDAINDKSEVSKKTKDFIDERLGKIAIDLANIQDSVKSFKSNNKITGLSNEGEIILEEASKNNEKLILLKSDLTLAQGVYKRLNASEGETLPPNLGLRDENIYQSILEYNKLVSQKNTLKVSAGPNNPNLKRIIKEVDLQRQNLVISIENLILALKSQIQQLQNVGEKIKSKISSIPVLERGFIDIARQQEIISGLYSYLLKKKEETAISLAVTVPNAKIIDVAYGNRIPVSPKRKIVYLAALLLGLIIPFAVIYVKNLLDTKIHGRKDIEELTSIPFLGDVPHSETKEKVVITKSSRSSTAEAFRLIRTNLDFILPNSEEATQKGKTIFVTSTTSGEGKSFISINLAAALSLSEKKVLLLGMDLRAPKVTEYLGIPERKGITNYIKNPELGIQDIIFSIPEIKGLDIIASGVIPPNPAELLLTNRVKELFEVVKKDYDYIIVDTAPVNLVTDTMLISKYADTFIYVTRANYLDKRMLQVPQSLYKEKKLPNMSIVLNDTDMKRGYVYGYGYGYGYGYVEQKKKSWYKKIFS